jgi:hypothetical protein
MELQRGQCSLVECKDTEQVREKSVVYGRRTILLLNFVVVLFLADQRLSKEQITVLVGRPSRREGHREGLGSFHSTSAAESRNMF